MQNRFSGIAFGTRTIFSTKQKYGILSGIKSDFDEGLKHNSFTREIGSQLCCKRHGNNTGLQYEIELGTMFALCQLLRIG